MTTQTYIEIARQPGKFTTEELRDALRFWHSRAICARVESHQIAAEIRRTWCLNALQSRKQAQ